ncbi:MAG: carbon-nitrogen hydrolase family protein [Cellvibrionaceae bacterium]
MSNLKAAVVQAATISGNTPETVKKVVDLIGECAAQDVQLAVFPEAFVGGYPKGATFGANIGVRSVEGRDEYRAYYDHAINVPGPETQRIGKAACDAHMFVVIGVMERDGGTLYCTALYFGPDGSLLGKHRKLMPTGTERLCWGFGDGSTLKTVETPWGPLGSVICWENYMPLLRQAMYSQNIKLYCAPTADSRETWVPTMRHIAMEGRCFVLSACQYMQRKDFQPDTYNAITDDPDDVLLCGRSLIVDPLGNVLAGPDCDGETILTATLDMDEYARGKFDFDVVGHYSRSDILSLHVNEKPQTSVIWNKKDAVS